MEIGLDLHFFIYQFKQIYEFANIINLALVKTDIPQLN